MLRTSDIPQARAAAEQKAKLGKLSFAWPRSMEQYPRDKDTNPLFAFGYGLSY